MCVFQMCTLPNFRFLNHILSFLKRTAMKLLGIAHSSIFDIAMKTQVCRNLNSGAPYEYRRLIDGKKCVNSPPCSATLVLHTNLRLHHKIRDNDVGISCI